MYFAEHFGIDNPQDHDWFDQLLDNDIRLFVDPFQIFKEPADSWWHSAHDKLIAYFQHAFEILAGHHNNPNSLQYRKVLKLMEFPEPEEFGLGFVRSGRRGSGTGKGFARLIVKAMSDAIDLGLQDMKHFEELGLLVESIGRDRISDITCNILKPYFITYTLTVASDLSIPTKSLKVEHAEYDETRMRWEPKNVELPINPYTQKPLLLTPWRFLRELPALNALDWWNSLDSDIRLDLNLHINRNVRKEEILKKARANTDKVREWAEARESSPASPYPVDRDPEGLHNWQSQTRDAASKYPLEISRVKTTDDLDKFVYEVINAFRHQVEEGGQWRLLFNDDSGLPKREESIQLLFRGVVESYCRAYGVRLDREVEVGRGPVDFVFTKDATTRVLLEIKKMENGRYWNGLEQQLVSYMTSDRCDTGWFLAVRLGDTKVQRERTVILPARTALAAQKTGFKLRSAWVDARKKKSASKIDEEDEGVKDAVTDPEFEE